MSRGRKYFDETERKLVDFVRNGIREYGSLQSFAESLGWDREAALKVRQSPLELSPNGRRADGRISNEYVSNKTDEEEAIFLFVKEYRRYKDIHKNRKQE